MEAEIVEAIEKETEFDMDKFFQILNNMMYKEIDFFRYVAKQGNMSAFRGAFKSTISQLIRVDLKTDNPYTKEEQFILGDLAAVCIAYSYLDWLAGDYGEIEISTVVNITKKILKETLNHITYVKHELD